MASAALEENLNVVNKEAAEITHAERIVMSDDVDESPRKFEDHGLTQKQIRKFMTKMDWRVLPMLGIIYAVSIIDRINVSTHFLQSIPCDLLVSTGSLVHGRCANKQCFSDRFRKSPRHARGP
jgi:hypothetical protein